MPECPDCGNTTIFEYCYTHIDIVWENDEIKSTDGADIGEIRCGKCNKNGIKDD